ncbi:hypothetical protein NQZ68_002514 [Dissostichus eleginoides]|nr:hypothetical protein NQZ68_002514 [Dissostichus eleginoides]
MGNAGQGYDVCSVFYPSACPSFPSASLCFRNVPPYSTSITHTPLLFQLFLSSYLPHSHCKADFLLSCSARVVVKCVQTVLILAPSGLQSPEHGEAEPGESGMKVDSDIKRLWTVSFHCVCNMTPGQVVIMTPSVLSRDRTYHRSVWPVDLKKEN